MHTTHARKNPRILKGFTLIELLVVVSIIGLLSSILITSLDTARMKGRDAVRKAQAKEFQKALQLYFITYGRFPYSHTDAALSVQNFTTDFNGAQSLVSAGFISKIPSDPTYPSTAVNTDCNLPGFGYCYCSAGGDSYVLTVNTEDDEGGTDRCWLRDGPNAALGLCQGHQGDAFDIAGEDCSERF